MANQTTNIGLQLYDEGDPANLADQYNNSMNTLDSMITTINNTTNNANSRLAALGITSDHDAETSKAEWDGAAALASTNEADIAEIDANLNALHANNVNDATKLYNTISTAMTSLKGTPIVFIGDSITQGYGATEPTTQRWSKLVCDYYGATEKNYAVGGSGFTVNGQSSNGRFDLQAQTAAADGSFDNSTVKLVFVSGGVNDGAPSSYAVADTNSEACVDTIRAAFPNAKIMSIIGLSGSLKYGAHSAGDTPIIKRLPYYRHLIQKMQSMHCATINGWKLFSIQSNYQSDDCLHPNTNGYSYIAGQVINTLEGGVINYSDQGYSWDLTNFSTAGSYLNLTFGNDFFNVNANLSYQFKEGDPGYGTTTSNGLKIISLPSFFRAGINATQNIYIPSCVFINKNFYNDSRGYVSILYSEGLSWIATNVNLQSNITDSTKIDIIFNVTLPLFGNN